MVSKAPIELVDTTNMSRADWLEWRRKGIGGSDLAAIMGMSPWATARDIYREKRKIPIALKEKIERANWVEKEIGHRLESLVAEIFAHKTGLKPYPVRKMFAHPDYPFMIANVDYLVDLPDGRTAILECKKTNARLKDEWVDGAIPMHYELQGRHYMVVMNVDVVFTACLYGNSEKEFEWLRFDRDMDFEADIIDTEKNFWLNHVVPGIEPPYTEKGDLVLQSIRNFYGNADTTAPTVLLPSDMFQSIETYLILKEEKAQLEQMLKALDNKVKKAQAVFIEKMGTACKAICKNGDNEIVITYNPVIKESFSKDALRAAHPGIYAEFFHTKESHRLLSVKKKGA